MQSRELISVHGLDEVPGARTRQEFLRMAAGAAIGVAGVAGIGAFLPGEAKAAGVFHTVTTTPVRNGPSIRSTQIGTLGGGVAVTVGSQTGGSKLFGGSYPNNGTWNRLTNGNWIHDHYLDTPARGPQIYFNDGTGGYALFSGAQLPRTTPSILGRTLHNSVAWFAETQMGITDYVGYCWGFCFDCWRYGADQDPPISGATAMAVWNAVVARGWARGGTPPEGAIAHWSYSGAAGHCAVSAGNGNVVSSYYGQSQTISWATIPQVTGALGGGRYLGWWYPG